jgi:LAS superfamily LD-carboxypeptidase LdcB
MNRDNDKIEATFIELKRASKTSLTMIILGAIALIGSLIYSGTRLAPLEEEISRKSSEIRRLENTEREYLERIKLAKAENASLVETAENLSERIEKDTAKFKKVQADLKSTVDQLEVLNAELADKLQLSALDGLRIEAFLKASKLISEAKKEGIDLKVIAGYRSLEVQEKMFEEKKARRPISVHNTGLAFDVAVVRDGKVGFIEQDEVRHVGEIGIRLGLRWGGQYYRSKNVLHFETLDAKDALKALISQARD